MNSKVCRCWMFVPANNPRFIERAWTRGADAYLLDLEDSVPEAEKEKARHLVREIISKVAKGGASVYLRVNKPYVEADLRAAVWPGIERVVLPKVESGEELRHASDLLTELEKERGIPVGSIEITPFIESALGVANIYEIVTSTPRIRTMGGGTGYDMALDLEVEMFATSNPYAYPEAACALAEMAVGVEAVGGVFVPNVSGRVDQGGVAMAAALHGTYVRETGVLHPALIQPLIDGLTPTVGEMRWARRVLDVWEELQQQGEAMDVVDGKVVDKYEYDWAKDLLQWADACAAKDRCKKRAIARVQAETPKEE